MKRLLLVLFTFMITWVGLNAQARHQKAITFNGENQYMKIPHSEDFNIPVNKSFTVSFWFNPAKTVADPNFQRMIAKRDLSPGWFADKTGWEIWGLDTQNKKFLAVNSPNASGNHRNSLSVWISSTGQLNQWYHVTFVVDRATNQMRSYFNGIKTHDTGTKNVTGWVTSNALPIYVGCGLNGGAQSFFYGGQIDDLRFYSKALSDTEVMADKDAVSVTADTDGLIAAYDFENFNYGDQTITDVTGKHTATLHNFPKAAGVNSITAYNEAGTNSGLVGRGNTQQVSRMTLALGRTATLENVKVSLEGTTSLSDIKKLKLYKSSKADRFDPRNAGEPIAEATSITDNNVTLTATGSAELQQGNVNLWVVADVADDATEGNDIAVKVLSVQLASEPNYTVSDSEVRKSNIVLQRTLIWAPGDEGSKHYRIPGIVRLANGNLVASIDRRKTDYRDLPRDIDVEVKISTDNGVTWGAPITVAQGTAAHGYGDAAMATDGTNIYMLLVGGEGLWSTNRNNTIQMYYTKSTDGGQSWSTLRNITDDIKGSLYPYGGFFGSGNGIITSTGKICFVAAMRTSSVAGGNMNNVLVYSDDKGDNWLVSPVARANGDESKVVELANGDLLISSRNRAGGANARTYVVSKDGGQSWSSPKVWDEITGNSCNAAIARYTLTRDGEQKNRLLHTLPASSKRENLTLFLSEDEGKTWPTSRVICKGEAAYSELVILPNGEIGIISEENDNPAYDIYFTKVSLNWLTKGVETYTKTSEKKCELPVISPEGGLKTTFPFDVTITTQTEGAKIYYTTDGSEPTESSTLYTAAFSLEAAATVKAIAIKENYTNSDVAQAMYTQRTSWDKPKGSHQADRYVQLISTEGAEQDLTYSADEAPSSLVVEVPSEIVTKQGQTFTIRIKSTENMKWTHAILFADWNRNFSFDDDGEEIHMEGIDAQGPKDKGNVLYKTGNLTVRDFTVTVTVPEGATIGKTMMRIQFNNAWHKKNDYGHSHSAMDNIETGRVYDVTMDIKKGEPVAQVVANPVFVTANDGSEYDAPLKVVLSCATEGATILYTLDGSDPNIDTGLVYDDNTGIILNTTTTIKAIAIKTGMTASAVVSSKYNVKMQQVATPVINNNADDNYTAGFELVMDITCATEDAKIIYTLDGKDPVNDSKAMVYDKSNPFKISQTTTVKVMAVKDGMKDSEVASKTFTFEKKTSIEDLQRLGLKVYPTFVKDNLTVEYTKRADAKLYSVSGQLLKAFVVDGKTVVNCSDIPSGLFLLVVDGKTVKLSK